MGWALIKTGIVKRGCENNARSVPVFQPFSKGVVESFAWNYFCLTASLATHILYSYLHHVCVHKNDGGLPYMPMRTYLSMCLLKVVVQNTLHGSAVLLGYFQMLRT
jgi:hypothetical protein